jgi:uncharacterized protein involved in exopolysaccharide biosynthesis
VKSDERTIADYVAILRRRWPVAAAVGGLIFLGFFTLAFSLPAIYEASAVIQIQQPQIPSSGGRPTSTSGSGSPEELIATVTQQVLTTENIINLIKKNNLYADRRSEPIDDLVAEFRSATSVVPTTASAVSSYGKTTEITYAFTVSFRDPDPEVAATVTNELANLHTVVGSQVRTQSAARTTAFLQSEANKVQKQIGDIEAKIAKLQANNAGALIAQNPIMAAQRFDQVDRELAEVEQSLRAARERKDLLESDLSQTPRNRPVLSDGQPIAGGADRLAVAQQELVQLQAKYSDDHPDIVRLKREIAALTAGGTGPSAQSAALRTSLLSAENELAAAKQTYSDNHPDVIRLQKTVDSLRKQVADAERRDAAAGVSGPPIDNPVYQQLLTRIRSADQEIADLSVRRAQLYAKLNQYNAGTDGEASYAALTRERDLLQEQYRDLRERYTQASLAESVEVDQKGQVLTLVDPARAPTFPVEPNRVMLVFLGLVLGLAAALSTASIAEAVDSTVRGSHDVAALLNTSPLVMIPQFGTAVDDRKRARMRMIAAMAAISIGALLVVLLT